MMNVCAEFLNEFCNSNNNNFSDSEEEDTSDEEEEEEVVLMQPQPQPQPHPQPQTHSQPPMLRTRCSLVLYHLPLSSLCGHTIIVCMSVAGIAHQIHQYTHTYTQYTQHIHT